MIPKLFIIKQFDVLAKTQTIFLDEKRTGVYSCTVCQTELFASQNKFDNCGWPSFDSPIEKGFH